MQLLRSCTPLLPVDYRLSTGDWRDGLSTGRSLAMKITSKTFNQWREGAGLTQKELSNILGKTEKTVGQWERSKSVPQMNVRLRLAEALGVSYADVRELVAFIEAAQTAAAEMEETVATADLDPRKPLGERPPRRSSRAKPR